MTKLIVAFRNFAKVSKIYIMDNLFLDNSLFCSLYVCGHVINLGTVKIATFYFQ